MPQPRGSVGLTARPVVSTQALFEHALSEGRDPVFYCGFVCRAQNTMVRGQARGKGGGPTSRASTPSTSRAAPQRAFLEGAEERRISVTTVPHDAFLPSGEGAHRISAADLENMSLFEFRPTWHRPAAAAAPGADD